jgi:hypothetical protein
MSRHRTTRRLRDLARSLRARLSAPRLDAELAAGADPASAPLLERRAHQLTAASTRRSLARSLEDLIRRAEQPPLPSFVLTPLWGRIRACRDALLGLAERLRDNRAVDVQGVAMVKVLLTDGRSPLYFEHASHSLPFLARRALFALDPPFEASQEKPGHVPVRPAAFAGRPTAA